MQIRIIEYSSYVHTSISYRQLLAFVVSSAFVCNKHCQLSAYSAIRFMDLRKENEIGLICSNCEVWPATHQCEQCDPSDCLLCAECRELHTKVKMYRGHLVMPIVNKIEFKFPEKNKKVTVTREHVAAGGNANCVSDGSPSLYDDVVISHGYGDTLNSGLLHTIWWWWNALLSNCDGTMQKIENNLEFIDVDDLLLYLGLSADDGMSMHGAMICLLVALTAHIVIKYVLGRRAIFALIGMGVALYRILKRRRNSINVEMGNLKKVIFLSSAYFYLFIY